MRDSRGNLFVREGDTIPFELKRVYYLYDVPSRSQRGIHSYIDQLKSFFTAYSVSFDMVLKDESSEIIITLNNPNFGFLIPKGIWRELYNFYSGAVCLVLASDVFDEQDYIREFDVFILFKNR